MTSLIWQIPVALFGSLLLMLVIYTPFSKYQALEREAVAKDDEIKRLKKARDKDAETLAQQIQQTKNMEGFWTERKAEVGLLTTERDLLKSQLASVSHSGRKLLNTEGMAALLALAEEWNKLHDAFLHRGVTDQAEIQLKDLTDRTEVFLKRELDDSHAAMVKNVPPEYPDLHGRQPREKHFVGLAAARLKKVNQIIEEQRRAH